MSRSTGTGPNAERGAADAGGNVALAAVSVGVLITVLSNLVTEDATLRAVVSVVGAAIAVVGVVMMLRARRSGGA